MESITLNTKRTTKPRMPSAGVTAAASAHDPGEAGNNIGLSVTNMRKRNQRGAIRKNLLIQKVRDDIVGRVSRLEYPYNMASRYPERKKKT